MLEWSTKCLKRLATPAGLEPATTCLEGGRSIEHFQGFQAIGLQLPPRDSLNNLDTM